MFFKDSLTLEREVLVLKPRKTLGKEEDLEGAEREAAGLGFESFEMVAMVIKGEREREREAERAGLVGGDFWSSQKDLEGENQAMKCLKSRR